MKKIIGFAVILTLLLSTTVFAAGDTEANLLCHYGILQGTNGDLMIDQYLTIEQLMVILCRLKGEEEKVLKSTMKTTFTDVPSKAWSYKYIAWAQSAKILNGNPDGTSGREDKVPAQRLAAFLLRILGFNDIKWTDVMTVAKQKALFDDVKVTATQNLKRGDVAIVLFNTLYAETSDRKILITKLPYGPKGYPVESLKDMEVNWIEEEQNSEYYQANFLGERTGMQGNIYDDQDIDIYELSIIEEGAVKITFDLLNDPYAYCEDIWVFLEDSKQKEVGRSTYTVTYDRKGVQYIKAQLKPGTYYLYLCTNPDNPRDIFWDSNSYRVRYTFEPAE